MATPNTLRDLREIWIARLNTFPALVALGISFEDAPSVPTADLESGVRRGYVAIGSEDAVGADGTVIQAELVTTVVAGAETAKPALDLVDDARVALLDAAIESAADRFGGVAGFAGYVRSTPASDGEGRRVYTARHFYLAVRYVNPISPTL